MLGKFSETLDQFPLTSQASVPPISEPTIDKGAELLPKHMASGKETVDE